MAIGLQAMIDQAAAKNGIPPALARALVHQESGGQVHITSPAGAKGLTQLMPATAASLGVNPDDPMQNLDGGFRYLAQQYQKFGSWNLALAAYNAGPGAVAKYGGVPPYAETQAYVKNIMAMAGNPSSGMVPATPASQAATPQQAPSPQAPPGPDLSQLLQPGLSPDPSQQGPLAPSPAVAGVQEGGGDMTQQLLQQEVNSPIPLPMPQASSPATPAPQALPSPVASGDGTHIAPVQGDYKFGRIDQGVDVSQAHPYISPGSGKVIRIGKVAGGTNLGVYVKLDKPITVNGRSYPGIYVWHTSPLVKPGQRVSAGQPIMSAGSAEVGFATASGRPVAPLVGGLGAGTKPTSPGQDMLAFFKAAGGK